MWFLAVLLFITSPVWVVLWAARLIISIIQEITHESRKANHGREAQDRTSR